MAYNVLDPYPKGWENPVNMRASAALPAAGAWDAAPTEQAIFGASGMTLSFTYTQGAAGGAFDYQIEVSPEGVAGDVPAGASEWVTESVYAAGGVVAGVDTQSREQREYQTYQATAAGAEITVNEVPGFPDEAWFAAQGAALAGDVDAVVASFGADVWVQPIAAAGKADTVIVGSFGAISDFYQQTFADGSVSAIAAEPTERFGIGVAQIINAVDGNADALEENGMATNAAQTLWIVTDVDTFNMLYDYEHGDGRAQFSEKLVDLIANLNPDASVTTLQELVKAYSLESILANQ